MIIYDFLNSKDIKKPDSDKLRLSNIENKLGNNFSSLVTCQKRENFTNLNSTSSFNISSKSNWNITSLLNFTDIYSSQFQKTTQDRLSSTGLYISQYEYACSFCISEDTTLTNLTFRVQNVFEPGISNISLRIKNATWNNSRPEPDATLFSSYISLPPSFGIWLNVSINLKLNISDTINRTFFVTAYDITGGPNDCSWACEDDATDGDNSLTYLWASSILTWGLIGYDFVCKLNFSNYHPLPSEANMQLNSSPLLDIGAGSGSIKLDEMQCQNNYVNLNLSANNFLTFNISSNSNFSIKANASSNYFIEPNAEYAYWNITLTNQELVNGANNGSIEIEIPSSWSVMDVLKNGTSWDWRYGSIIIENITSTAPSNYTMIARDSNYVSHVTFEKKIAPSNYLNITDSPVVNIQNIIRINSRLNNSALDGLGNLTIFNPLGIKIYSALNSSPILDNITFIEINITNYSGMNGTYTFQVEWWNGTAVGCKNMTFSVLNSTIGQKEQPRLIPFFNIEQGLPLTLIIIIGIVSAVVVIIAFVLIKRKQVDKKIGIKEEIDDIFKDLEKI
ncbi:MAG: hypothetical protein ACFFCM_14170 [Promethearchaeota archaeon]